MKCKAEFVVEGSMVFPALVLLFFAYVSYLLTSIGRLKEMVDMLDRRAIGYGSVIATMSDSVWDHEEFDSMMRFTEEIRLESILYENVMK